MTDFRRTIRLAQGRWNRALFWGLSGAGLGMGLLFGGTAVLIGRVWGYRWDLPAALAGFALGLSWALLRYRNRRVDAAQMATLLDLRQGGTGQLLFELETGQKAGPAGSTTAGSRGSRPSRAPSPTPATELTRPRPDYRRVGRTMLPGVAFFIAAMLVPVRLMATSNVDPISAQRIEELAELAQKLDENLNLEEELREEIAQNLAALEANTGDERPQGDTMREALDQLEARLEQTAAEHAQQLEDFVRQASEAAAEAASPDPTQRENALNELGKMAGQMQDAGILPQMLLTEQLMQELADLGLSQKALDQLKELAQSGDLRELGKLAQELGLSAEAARMLADAMAMQLSQEALQKLAELAKQGLLNQSGQAGGKPMTAEQLEELLKRLENQPGGT